jgi:hypothetical protein
VLVHVPLQYRKLLVCADFDVALRVSEPYASFAHPFQPLPRPRLETALTRLEPLCSLIVGSNYLAQTHVGPSQVCDESMT